MATTQPPLLKATGIHMAFGGVDVVKNVDFALYPGEIHALVGENGAGKSTLSKVIAGIHQPRLGHIEVNGHPVIISNPHVATALGIALIPQEPLVFPDLSVAENIFVGRHPRRTGAWVDWGSMYGRARELLDSLGLHVDPKTRLRGLCLADQQMVSMAAALSENARILLMDEPTSALTPNEVERLFTIMRRLRAQGVAIVFISHRLDEVFAISDRISVMRDGEMVGQRTPATTSTDEIIQLMVGRPLMALFERPASYRVGDPVLEVRSLSLRGRFENISFTVRAGEIVGLAGLVGAGRTDVGQALFGVTPAERGTITIGGVPRRISSPRDAMRYGLVYVPEDRQHHGLLMPMSVLHNVTLPTLERFASGGWLREQTERQSTQEYVQRLRIVLRHVEQPVRELSGGNQQKAVLSKWLLTRPKVIILDEPTRGIDIGAKAEVHRLMGELAAQGMAILMISSEMPEILAMSDRVLVMRDGRLVAEFQRAELSAEQIMAAATGQILEREANDNGQQRVRC